MGRVKKLDTMNPQNCWEYWKCPEEVRKDCAAFVNDMGRECFFVAGTIVKNPGCMKVKNNILDCWDCPWYKVVKG